MLTSAARGTVSAYSPPPPFEIMASIGKGTQGPSSLTAPSDLLLFRWRVESLNRSTATALVCVNSKHQVVIPQNVREKLGLNVGDLLEAKAEHGKITLTPKLLVDRGIAESLADFREGRTYGPFETHEGLVRSLHEQTAELRSKRTSRKARRT